MEQRPDATFGFTAAGNRRPGVSGSGKRERSQSTSTPYCNSTAAVMADKWIAPRPDTGAALALAIAFVWMEEGTSTSLCRDPYRRFEEFEKLRQREKGQDPKDAGWAEEDTGVPGGRSGPLQGVGLEEDGGRHRHQRRLGGRAERLRHGMDEAGGNCSRRCRAWASRGSASGDDHGAALQCHFSFPVVRWVRDENLAGNPPSSVTQRIYRLLLPEPSESADPVAGWKESAGSSLEQQFVPNTYPEPGRSEG